MSNLKTLKTRIQSVQSTRKITSAMYMVAAAKFRRAQNRWETAEGYANAITSILRSLPSQALQESENPLVYNSNPGSTLVLLLSADRGLCGGFNNQLFRKTREYLNALKSENQPFSVVCIGKKATEFVKNNYPAYLKSCIPSLQDIDYTDLQTLTADIETAVYTEGFSKCVILSNQYSSPLQQVPSCNILLPLSATLPSTENGSQSLTHLPYFVPEEGEFLMSFLLQYIKGLLWSYINQTAIGEYAARMTAMDSATKSCDDMIHNLKLEYNQTRQARITNELIEIISGAEALQKG